MSTLSIATIKSQNTLPPAVQNSSGTEIGTFCRAWVNFNGTGTVAIAASFNVSSITDNGTGDYTVNFTTAMSDTNYAVTICPTNNGTGSSFISYLPNGGTYTTSAVKLLTSNTTINGDSARVNVVVFR